MPEGLTIEAMTTQDERAIRSVVAAFIDSWNRHDVGMLAALFTDDADFVDVFGNWFKDRMAIERALAQRHATVFKESRFAEKEVAIRLHKPDLAIVTQLSNSAAPSTSKVSNCRPGSASSRL